MLFYDYVAISRPAPRSGGDLIDFDFLVKLAPEPNELPQPLLTHLAHPPLIPSDLARLAIEWRAWISKIDVAQFVRSLLRLLHRDGKWQIDPGSSEAAFRNAAALIFAACDSSGVDRERSLGVVIETVADILREREDRPMFTNARNARESG
jgi:hypothetical protein